MKRLWVKIVCIAAACVFLALVILGVSGFFTKPAEKTTPPAPAPTKENYIYAETVNIFFYSEEDDELDCRQESIVTNEYMTLSELIIRHIIFRQKPLFSGIELINVSQSGEVLFVNFSSGLLQVEAYRRFCAILVLAASLDNVDNIHYISVLVDGTAFSDGAGINPLFPTSVSGHVRDLYEDHLNRTEGPVAVFFSEVSRRFVVAEIRNIDLRTEDPLREMLILLANGPYGALLTDIAPRKMLGSVEVEPIVLDEKKGLILSFFSEESAYFLNNEYNLYFFVAAITNTVQCAIPDIGFIRIRINDQYLELNNYGYGYLDPDYYRGQFITEIGNTITLYYPSAQKPGSMIRIRRAISGRYCNMLTRIRELFRQPVEAEGAKEYCFSQITARSILSAVMYGNDLVVDISEEMYSVLNKADPVESKAAVFGIVNTVCDVSRIKRVRFTVNDKPVDRIGRLDVSDWMYPLYGITEG